MAKIFLKNDVHVTRKQDFLLTQTCDNCLIFESIEKDEQCQDLDFSKKEDTLALLKIIKAGR